MGITAAFSTLPSWQILDLSQLLAKLATRQRPRQQKRKGKDSFLLFPLVIIVFGDYFQTVTIIFLFVSFYTIITSSELSPQARWLLRNHSLSTIRTHDEWPFTGAHPRRAIDIRARAMSTARAQGLCAFIQAVAETDKFGRIWHENGTAILICKPEHHKHFGWKVSFTVHVGKYQLGSAIYSVVDDGNEVETLETFAYFG